MFFEGSVYALCEDHSTDCVCIHAHIEATGKNYMDMKILWN